MTRTSTNSPRAAIDPSARPGLLALGARRESSWPFLNAAFPLLNAGDRDPELSALIAAHAIRLGLRILALDVLGALPGDYHADPQVIALRSAASALPKEHAISPDRRIDRAGRNLSVLAHAAEALRIAFDDWAKRASAAEAYQSSDSGVAIRRVNASGVAVSIFPPPSRSGSLRDQPARDPTASPALLFDGLTAVREILEQVKAHEGAHAAYAPRIWIAEPNPDVALDALSLVELPSDAQEPRVLWFIGDGAHTRLQGRLLEHIDEHLPSPAPCVAASTSPPGDTERALAKALAAQRTEHERLHAVLERRMSTRDSQWWARRFNATPDRRPRAMIATTRYSTFMRYAADDLAIALRAAGAEVSVFLERDRHSKVSSVAYLRAIESFDPDVLILINYPRSSLKSAIPTGLPCITWTQDAMPHLFSEGTTADRDFLVGNFSTRVRSMGGYRPDNTLRWPVPASTHKFHPAPVASDLRREHECEIAYVGHQSETAEAFHRRSVAALHARSPEVDVFERLYERIRAMIACSTTVWSHDLRTAITDEVERRVGRSPSPADIERLLALYAQPLADRMLRHETLEWAAEIARRKGWRLRIHGRGWDAHPTLAPFAHPELLHGEPLRAFYQCARAHLHVSVTTLCHQRVFECALSGGLPLCRMIADASIASYESAIASAMRRAHPRGFPSHAMAEAAVTDDPALLDLMTTRRRLGWTTRDHVSISPGLERRIRSDDVVPYTHCPAWLLGDLSAVTYLSRTELEQRLTNAVDDDRWRASMSIAIADRVRDHASHEALAHAMLKLLRDRAASLTQRTEDAESFAASRAS